MEDTLIKYCDNCGEEMPTSIIKRPASYTFKGQTFEIMELVRQCCGCGQDLYDEELDSNTLSQLAELYTQRMGLSLEEIKDIRSKYGLSMSLFARILGWSKATIARYESGKFVPSNSHMMILKNLKDHPEAIFDYYKQNKNKFSAREQLKIEEKIKKLDDKLVESNLIGALKLNYQQYENTVVSGYSSFALDKLINMIVFFAKKGIKKTKLMKLLFYSDFIKYKRNLLSMSGIPYIKYPFGPVPKDYDLLLSTLEKSNVIKIENEYDKEYTITHIHSNIDFDESIFDEEELSILHQVEDYFKTFGSVAISEFSHEEDAWKYTDDRELISYDFAETLHLD